MGCSPAPPGRDSWDQPVAPFSGVRSKGENGENGCLVPGMGGVGGYSEYTSGGGEGGGIQSIQEVLLGIKAARMYAHSSVQKSI